MFFWNELTNGFIGKLQRIFKRLQPNDYAIRLVRGYLCPMPSDQYIFNEIQIAMKTLKSISVVILLTVALLNTANAEGAKVKATSVTINMVFADAMQSAGLVQAMHQQLCAECLGGPGVQYVTFSVHYGNHAYLITGSYYQWLMFFKMRPSVKTYKQPVN